MGTMHRKEEQVAPAFARQLGAHVIAPAGIDTDQFGAFTGEVTRTLAPTEAAAAKARLAMQVAGVDYGLASEASYDTWCGIMPAHEEILMFVDDARGIHVVEAVNACGAPGAPRLVDGAKEAAAAARSYGFPGQGVSVRATVADRARVFAKGITDTGELAEVVSAAVAAADTGQAWLEPDLRAHHNPSRRAVITDLAGRLARRLATPCPRCACPGYGRLAVRDGLPCQVCGCPTGLVAADIHGCAACEHRHTVARTVPPAEPRFCPRCNP